MACCFDCKIAVVDNRGLFLTRQAVRSQLAAMPHDLRHQTITELSESGAPDSVIQAIAGHMSKRMVDHYSHVRRAAKREAVDKLAGGLMAPDPVDEADENVKPN